MTRTLQELDEAIAALEQGASADQLTPGVFSINSQGQVEEKLSGRLEALGITVKAGGISLPNGTFVGSSPGLKLEGLSEPSEIRFGAHGEGGAILRAFHYAGMPPSLIKRELLQLFGESVKGLVGGFQVLTDEQNAVTKVQAVAGEETPTIVDSEGNSSFLQLAQNESWRMNVGYSELTWSGGSEAKRVIEHGMPKTPGVVLATLVGPGPGAPISLYTDTYAATTFTAHGWNSSPSSGTVGFVWLAIG